MAQRYGAGLLNLFPHGYLGSTPSPGVFKMKKWLAVVLIVVITLASVLVILRSLNGGEDTWIKDSRGVYVKHGNPSLTPGYVLEQQYLINDSLALYNEKKTQGMNFSSQCLGTINDYAVDIVHVPRASEDNLPENQCPDYLEGKVHHFIEFDANGEIVRIV